MKLYKLHKNKFSTDFDKNKVAVQGVLITKYKKMRNIVAGYITRLVKKNTD